MNLYAPEYYNSFACIADRCRHSCCIGWEIDVDEEALEKYDSSAEDYAEVVRKSIEQDDVPHFRLCEGGRCPHLRGDGLCQMILSLGEDYLCSICREHPRFYNDTVRGREVGLGLVCEEACRIILSSDGYRNMADLGSVSDYTPETDGYDAVSQREAIFDILSDRAIPYGERLTLISNKYSVSPASIPDERWCELLSSLEYLSEDDRRLFAAYSSLSEAPSSLEEYLERALAYFVYRHTSAAEDDVDFRASLGLSLFLERLLCSAIASNGSSDFNAVCDIARRLSEELEYSEENTEAIKFEFAFG